MANKLVDPGNLESLVYPGRKSELVMDKYGKKCLLMGECGGMGTKTAGVEQ